MTKQGFYFNMDACIGCRTCQIACKDKNDLEIGIKFRHLRDFEVGEYPSVGAYHFSATCNHCMDPACVKACPNGAMFIDEEDGTVQHDDTKCLGCRYCVEACPYAVPQYIESINLTRKCDACKQLREAGDVSRLVPCGHSNLVHMMSLWLRTRMRLAKLLRYPTRRRPAHAR